jgi:hypothetical protein
MSRTGTLGRLFGHVAEPALQMNLQDMTRRLLKEGDLVHVTSKRGSIVVPLQASPEVAVSQAFMAMHWGEEYLSGVSSHGERLAGVNALTTSAYCPSSKQPELKHAAVKILKAELPWSLLAMAWLPDGEALSARTQLKHLMAAFPFTSCVPFSNHTALADRSHERTGVLFRAAGYEAPSGSVLAQIEAALCLSGADALRYADAKKPAPHRSPGTPRRPSRTHRLCTGGRHPRRGLDQNLAAGRAASASLRPPTSIARSQSARGGAVPRQAGLYLLQRDRCRHCSPAGVDSRGRWRRSRFDARRTTLGALSTANPCMSK